MRLGTNLAKSQTDGILENFKQYSGFFILSLVNTLFGSMKVFGNKELEKKKRIVNE